MYNYAGKRKEILNLSLEIWKKSRYDKKSGVDCRGILEHRKEE